MLFKKVLGIIVFAVFCGLLLNGCRSAGIKQQEETAINNMVSSPDRKIQVSFLLNETGEPMYSVAYGGKPVLKPSPLGLVRNDQPFVNNLKLAWTSTSEPVKDSYRMLTGKRKQCQYAASRKTFRLLNQAGASIDIIFQVSNDGVAFQYGFGGNPGDDVSVIDEKTGFAFAEDTLSWLHFMPVCKSGWSRTQPSYEEYYEAAKPVGAPSPAGQGWCLPALFKTTDDIWVLICDSDVDGRYFGARLGHDSTGGVYHVAMPQKQGHRGSEDPVAPQITLPFKSPWRVLMIGPSPGTMVQSTLMTDVAQASKVADTGFIRPGKAAWHWLRYGDDSSTLEYADSFLDFAAKMNWEYMLVDANWDQNIGYEKMVEFVKKAHSKGVNVILWYNSNGLWNDAPMTPKNRMDTAEARCEEFTRLEQMGVKGVKVDFFGGDKQATMQLYMDICRDAAEHGIMVNFHGATIPRGWQRTWPNLMTMESVRGMEYCTFDQRNTDKQAWHSTILPFTRNAIGSMDFTPVVFDPHIRGVWLKTQPAFELALTVVFESGIEHLGLVPAEYNGIPDYVIRYLQQVPTAWDETRFVAGYPGDYAVIARRDGSTWYVAGINGKNQSRTLTLDLSFLPAGAAAELITDGDARSFIQKNISGTNLQDFNIELKGQGGFVMTIKP